MSEEIKPVIQDTIDHFPNRFLTSKEKLLIIAQVLRHTSTKLANTLPPEIRLETKIADSNMIQRLLENCTENDADKLFLNIGAQIRNHLTHKPELLGLIPVKEQRIIH